MSNNKTRKVIPVICCTLIVFFSFLLFFSGVWVSQKYGKISVNAILFTLFSELRGVSIQYVISYAVRALFPALLFSLITLLFFFYSRSEEKPARLPLLRKPRKALKTPAAIALSLLLCALSIISVDVQFGLRAFIRDSLNASTLFETHYVDPKTTRITFPEQKRNLIYIYLESMETTLFSKEQGGALSSNAIEELYDLAAQNINFSHNDSIGGSKQVADLTIGALVAQSAGIPLKLPLGIERNEMSRYKRFLPGATTLMDILRDNGYYQVFMCGSEAEFGGRFKYFEQHGIDKIYDYFSAQKDGIIPVGFREWWGMSDQYLFQYAKQELPKIAASEEPFAFTMLTVDTHHPNGYLCPYCKNEYEEDYVNVYACSSRQILSFMDWLAQQDFYENTTVILTGDHLSMNENFMNQLADGRDARYVYNCFINSAVQPVQEKNRVFTQLDMLPTTLAAMGCAIEGDRLALGANLFSDTPTLSEEMGFDVFFTELSKRSKMYDAQFLRPLEHMKLFL